MEEPRRSIPDDAICFFREGNKWACVYGNFRNLQESPAGFGDDFESALADLQREEEKRGFRPVTLAEMER